ncbi:hypothetical protein HMPREF9104_02662 [Lentilactobacillus kisonensis F0435]|uniref:Uncharacterized protein n=1 Tax=Lentilactobacillus kisonensis F0435 TaxID=797516 RepID=H1LJ70_9LACO|nr:hypothetical protein HMPREF9104_02662 [Lentilactobacillus kisonensis F0435]
MPTRKCQHQLLGTAGKPPCGAGLTGNIRFIYVIIDLIYNFL